MWMAYILIYSYVPWHRRKKRPMTPWVRRDYADFNIPPPFSSRVRNALNAEARSVRLTSLVGQGGMWYTFGVMIMRLCVPS